MGQTRVSTAGLDAAEDGRWDAGDDGTAIAIIGFLRSEGAAGLRHAGGRGLLDHLVGTYSIMRRWGQPAWLQHAALVHSVYGTDAYDKVLLSGSRRDSVRASAGERAERIAYLFCVTPRQPLFAGTHRWARDLPTRTVDVAGEQTVADAPSRAELDAVLLLHMANLADQAHAADGRPAHWLVRVRGLGELLADSDDVAPPGFIDRLAAFSDADESLVRGTYLRAVDDREDRPSDFALAAATCPVLAEPCVWLSHLERCQGNGAISRLWAAEAHKRLLELGTAWDRRLTFEEWLALIEALGSASDDAPVTAAGAITHPRCLFEAIMGVGAAQPPRPVSRANASAVPPPPDEPAGRERFLRYVEALSDPEANGGSRNYPDLPSRPWHDPREIPLVAYLESNFEAIREEILALDGARFQRESERIGRTGDWDVAFFSERGRRHDEVWAGCPVTARGIETHPTIQTPTGLIYVSRMRAGTHISPHRGPANDRLRCHLGITVPDGDCGIRVADKTRRWEDGRCLVFDDHFEHEAWNRTDEDRIVLIIDIWHPGLSATEVMLLEALDRHTYRQARRLNRYWAANASARGD